MTSEEKRTKDDSEISLDEGLLYPADKPLSILFEICSLWNLPKADVVGHNDPYVCVDLVPVDPNAQSERIHKTAVLNNVDIAIYTVLSDCFGLFTKTPAELRSAYRCICFHVRDFDSLAKNDEIGKVEIPIEDLLGGMLDEQRRSFRIDLGDEFATFDDSHEIVQKSKALGQLAFPSLALRFRVATDADNLFMEVTSKNNRKTFASYGDRFRKMLKLDKKNKQDIRSKKRSTISRFSGEASRLSTKLRKGARVAKHEQFFVNDLDRQEEVNMYEVYPEPPPDMNVKKFMTSEEIYSESLKPSNEWEDAGSGSGGFIFLEVLGCEDLPRLDPYTLGKTDAYLLCCYEDVWLQTDVVPSCLSPSWMPWSKRAFALRVNNFNSALFVGVFDRDVTEFDDFAGHVVIKPSTFVSSTEYTLTYELLKSVSFPAIDPENGNGRVRLRIRVERDSRHLLSAFCLTPTSFVNTSREGIDDTIEKACYGIALSPTKTVKRSTLFACSNELRRYLIDLIIYVSQGCTNIFLWRGHIEVSIPKWGRKGKSNEINVNESLPLLQTSKEKEKIPIKLPFPYNSIILFIWGTFLVENPSFIPSFLLFLIPWFLFAQHYEASKHPSPWHRPQSFSSLIMPLLNMKPNYSVSALSEKEKEKIDLEIKAKEDEWEGKIEKFLVDLKVQAELQGYVSAAMLLPMEDIDTTKITGLLSFLMPFQLLFCNVVTLARCIKQFSRWDFPHTCLLLSIAGLLLSLVFALVAPFLSTVCKWTLRIVVWMFLGPQTGILAYAIKKKNEKNNAIIKQNESRISWVRSMKESAEKLKAIMQVRYGKYVKTVSTFRACRADHYPLAVKSEAKPFKSLSTSSIRRKRIPGNALEGSMIPVQKTDYGRPQRFFSFFGQVECSKLIFEFSCEGLPALEDSPLGEHCFFKLFREKYDNEDECLYVSEATPRKNSKWKRGVINWNLLSSQNEVNLKIELYFGSELEEQYVGAASTTLKKLLKCSISLIEIDGQAAGTLIPTFVEVSSDKFEDKVEDSVAIDEEEESEKQSLKFHIVGESLKNAEGVLRKSDPFYTIMMNPGTDEEKRVYTSKVFKNNLNPYWTAGSFALDTIESEFYNKVLRITVYDHERDGNHVLIGYNEITIRDFVKAQYGDVLYLQNGRRKSKKFGKLNVLDAMVSGTLSKRSDCSLETDEESSDFVRRATSSVINNVSEDVQNKGHNVGEQHDEISTDKSIEVPLVSGHGLQTDDGCDDQMTSRSTDLKKYLQLTLIGYKLSNVEEGLFTKSDPFYEIFNLDDRSKAVYRSNVVRNNLSPIWEQANLNLAKICGGDLTQLMLIKVYDWEKDGEHDLIGTLEASVEELLAKQVSLIKGEKKPKDTSKAFHLCVEGSKSSRGTIFVTFASLL